MHVSIGASNGSQPVNVDLYFVLLIPDGKLYFSPSWTLALESITGIRLPANFELPEKGVFVYELPSNLPPIKVTGNYTFAVGLAETGTLNFLTLNTADFTYIAGDAIRKARLLLSLWRSYNPVMDDYPMITSMFYEYPEEPEQDPIPELGDCIFIETNEWGSSGSGTELQAGDKILVKGSPNGDFYLEWYNYPYTNFYSYEPDRMLDGSDFAYLTEYSFIGSGGNDVGPFNENITSPSDFRVTSPVLGPGLKIDKNEPLQLTWSGAQGTPYELEVLALTQVEEHQTYCLCRFEDTGSATIPAGMLSNLMEPVPTDPLFMSYLMVTKVKIETVYIDGIKTFKESSIIEDSNCSYE